MTRNVAARIAWTAYLFEPVILYVSGLLFAAILGPFSIPALPFPSLKARFLWEALYQLPFALLFVFGGGRLLWLLFFFADGVLCGFFSNVSGLRPVLLPLFFFARAFCPLLFWSHRGRPFRTEVLAAAFFLCPLISTVCIL